MWFDIKLAWRNVLRNKRRTVIAGIAIGIGLACLIFYDGLIIGMEELSIRGSTETFLGEAQIHRKGFLDTWDTALTIRESRKVIDKLKTDSRVQDYSPRTLAMAMISSPAGVNSVQLVGLDPSRERHVTRINDAIMEGAFFEGDNPRDIIIGSELARILQTGLGDRVVITVSMTETGDLVQEMFRISGIYHFSIKEMDQGMALVRLPVAQTMLGIDDRIHEIAVRFTQLQYASRKDLPFWTTYSAHGNEAVSWEDRLPQLKTLFEMT